jgi:hypothetical protein
MEDKPAVIFITGKAGLETFFVFDYARYNPDWPFRAPHHTISELGALSELALAAGGILYLNEAIEFRKPVLSAIYRVWVKMYPKVRPVIIAHLNKECVSAWSRATEPLTGFDGNEPAIFDLDIVDSLFNIPIRHPEI